MSYDYDRSGKTARAFPYSAPSQADEAATQAYLSLLSFKGGFDAMEEIPKNFHPYYDQCMKAIGAIQKAQQETYQLRMMARKLPR